jgi:hypothetical protein
MKSLQEIFLSHYDVIDKDGEKIIKFKDSKQADNVTTNKKRKRKSNSGNVK